MHPTPEKHHVIIVSCTEPTRCTTHATPYSLHAAPYIMAPWHTPCASCHDRATRLRVSECAQVAAVTELVPINNTRLHEHTHTHTYKHTHTHTHTHIRKQEHAQNTHTHTHIRKQEHARNTHTHTHIDQRLAAHTLTTFCRLAGSLGWAAAAVFALGPAPGAPSSSSSSPSGID